MSLRATSCYASMLLSSCYWSLWYWLYAGSSCWNRQWKRMA